MPISAPYLIQYVTCTYIVGQLGKLQTWRCQLQECLYSSLLRTPSVSTLLKLWQCSACLTKFSVLCECCSCECCIFRLWRWLQWCFQNVWNRGYVLPMAEEELSGIRPLLDRRTQATKVGILFRWYKESGTMACNPGNTGFFLCYFQRLAEEAFCT